MNDVPFVEFLRFGIKLLWLVCFLPSEPRFVLMSGVSCHVFFCSVLETICAAPSLRTFSLPPHLVLAAPSLEKRSAACAWRW